MILPGRKHDDAQDAKSNEFHAGKQDFVEKLCLDDNDDDDDG